MKRLKNISENNMRISLKYFRSKILLLVYILTVSINIQAQNTNLFQLLEKGKQKYPLLKAKEANVESSERNVRSARTAYIPDLSIGHQYTYATSNNVEGAFYPSGPLTISPSGGIHPITNNQAIFGSFTTALLEWNIVNFGKVSAGINAAKAEKTSAQADYENELFQYQIRLADTYLLLLISHHLKETQQYNLQRAEAFRNTTHAKVSSGLRPGVDSSFANAEYAKAKLLFLESEKNEQAYMYRLNELLGTVKNSISIDSMNFFSELPHSRDFSTENIVHSPFLRFHQSYIDLSKARSISVKRSFYPSLSLVAAGWARGSGISNKTGSFRSDIGSGIDYQVSNYLLGIALRWNLTDYFRIHNDYKSLLYQAEKYEHLYLNQLLSQKRQLKEAEMRFEVSLQQAELAPLQFDAAQSAFEQAQARYESGLTDLPTFSQSLAIVNRAEADKYIAYSNAWRALLMKAAMAGDLSLFLNQVKQ